MNTNVNTSTEGSLYELVCRGKKDTFLFKDSPKSRYVFDNAYEPEEKTLFERRIKQPKTGVEFGRTVEFEVEPVGDIIKSFSFLIQLPSWIPSTIQKNFHTTTIQDQSGVSYGYVNSIAYFLFERIQVYQDAILLQDFTGDALWAMNGTQGTYARKRLIASITGAHDGSDLSIGRNAMPGQLVLQVPILGCQKGGNGFPIRAAMSHTYTVKCKLRKLEHLIEASDKRDHPSPWGKSFQVLHASGPPTSFTSLQVTDMQPLRITMETIQYYVSRQVQDELARKPIEVLFFQIYENIFTLNPSDYTSGGLKKLRLYGCHPTSRIIWIIRSISDINANLLWKVSPDIGGAYYTSASLVIAGQTRESEWDTSVWRDVTNFAKENIDPQNETNTMNWSLGDNEDQLNGTINMSSADRPTLTLNLVFPGGQAYHTELRAFTQGWTSFQTDGKGRAELLSFN
jgi:hypothetical protein